MGKSLVLKVLDKQNNLSEFSLLAFIFFVFLLSSLVFPQIIIKEKVEINPQSVILPDAPLSNHTIRVDIQWSPASLPGWIMYYDLGCDQNSYSSASTTTGSNTFSHSSLGYENYQIQFRFGSLDPNQPTITGTYQLYYDEQLIRSESFQAQKATYSSYAYFNTHYQSPVLTDYNFSIFTSEICPGSYEDIYITTSRNCNATAEINTELDSITLTIETGREFVSFYKNSQKKDTVTFMYHELGSVYLRQDSTYTGTAPINVNIKSDWTGIIKYQQLIINPQEQFQIRVPDQPIIVFSGGVRGFKIETYSSGNCPPFISENLRYTALIKKGSNRGLLYYYDTGNSGDTLTNLTPQEDGEKYLDFITEGEILNEADTVLIKIFSNNENIDTTEAEIIIYPNDIDVQIIPSVISQGDTSRVVLKKRGVNGLEDFAPDKVFNVEIVQGLDYGLILDSLSNDTLTIFSNIPQGFKIIAKDSTGIDSTRIRIKVSTEESGFPVARMIKNKTKTNKKEIVDDNENQKSDDEIITPDWIIPGPILLEGFGDMIVKGDECDEFSCGAQVGLPNIKYKQQTSGYMGGSTCASDLNLAGFFQVFRLDTGYIFGIQNVCFDAVNNRWWFNLFDENSFIVNYVISVCTTNITKANKQLIKDYKFFPVNYGCDSIMRDLKEEKKYVNGKGHYVSERIILLHENEHLEEFQEILNDFLGLLHSNLISIANKMTCESFNSLTEAEMFWGTEIDRIYLDWYESIYAYYLGVTRRFGTPLEQLEYETEIHNRILPEIMMYIDTAKLYHGCK